jgi:hypothetical protein
MEPYHVGVLSYFVGKTRAQNPFDSHTEAFSYDTWEAGWLDAYDDHQKVLEECSSADHVYDEPYDAKQE